MTCNPLFAVPQMHGANNDETVEMMRINNDC